MRERLVGIYRITCTATKKYYIGSSKDITDRWWNHKTHLRRGTHGNPLLQHSWNKHGEEAFKFDIIEACSPGERFAQEQKWIDNTRSADRRFGYNLQGVVEALSDMNCKEYTVTKPDGAEEKIRNLSDYCHKNGLNSGAMSQVSLGNANQHKGYKCRLATMTAEEWEKSKKRHWKSGGAGWKGRWKIMHPDGTEEVIDSLTEFCKNNGLSQGNMTEVAKGKRKQHRGFRCEMVGETS